MMNHTTCQLFYTPNLLPGHSALILMITLPHLKKKSQEHDDTQEANFSSFPPDPPQDNGTPTNTNKANTSKPEPERIRLTAQMVADDIEEIRFHTSSHSEYLDKFQGYLERMTDNVCILNETTKANLLNNNNCK
ncbi:unnamed protein product [Lactuca virosa]|uniref:Uncharacterized protein n=1 Tax=Lactuca virosa TaxID=75947 RepID=A0AAU9MGE7_9ASTR|nr:unnamed protein product [Lactuca virosa]